MPYRATIGEHSYELRFDEDETSSVSHIICSNQDYSLAWQQVAPLASADFQGGRYHLLLNDRSYEVFARRVTSPDEQSEERYELQFGGRRFEVHIEDERSRRLAELASSASSTSEARLRAPMPGLVAGLPVSVGSPVTAGQTIVILEAMKMENDLSAPISGTLQALHIEIGQTVDQGALLATIEP